MKETRTSETHPIELALLDPELVKANGQIALSYAPGKHDEESKLIWQRDLDADMARLKEHYNIDRAVVLLEDFELPKLGIANLFEKYETNGIQTHHFPVDDHGKPESMDDFKAAVDFVIEGIDAGEKVMIHCKGGRGRTGMLAAAALVKKGHSPDDAIALIKENREGALSVENKCEAVREYGEAIRARN